MTLFREQDAEGELEAAAAVTWAEVEAGVEKERIGGETAGVKKGKVNAGAEAEKKNIKNEDLGLEKGKADQGRRIEERDPNQEVEKNTQRTEIETRL